MTALVRAGTGPKTVKAVKPERRFERHSLSQICLTDMHFCPFWPGWHIMKSISYGEHEGAIRTNPSSSANSSLLSQSEARSAAGTDSRYAVMRSRSFGGKR